VGEGTLSVFDAVLCGEQAGAISFAVRWEGLVESAVKPLLAPLLHLDRHGGTCVVCYRENG
jgi:hypothetical protein